MARVSKVQCDNCTARSRRVRPYLVGGQRKDLCLACVRAAIKVELQIKNL